MPKSSSRRSSGRRRGRASASASRRSKTQRRSRARTGRRRHLQSGG